MKKGRTTKRVSKPVLGWREWISLPELGVDAIKAKIDTGARTSALHAYQVTPFEEHGRRRVRFVVRPVQRRKMPQIECVADVVDERMVTSSNGQRERRLVIATRVEVGGKTWPIEITLTDRDEMNFRMLLGRQALRRRVLIDPGRSFRAGTEADTAKVTKKPGRSS